MLPSELFCHFDSVNDPFGVSFSIVVQPSGTWAANAAPVYAVVADAAVPFDAGEVLVPPEELAGAVEVDGVEVDGVDVDDVEADDVEADGADVDGADVDPGLVVAPAAVEDVEVDVEELPVAVFAGAADPFPWWLPAWCRAAACVTVFAPPPPPPFETMIAIATIASSTRPPTASRRARPPSAGGGLPFSIPRRGSGRLGPPGSAQITGGGAIASVGGAIASLATPASALPRSAPQRRQTPTRGELR